MKFAPFKPCTLPKHVRVEILHREFPVKNLYFPCKGLQCGHIGTLIPIGQYCPKNIIQANPYKSWGSGSPSV